MDVLVVESEPLVREMVTEWLEEAGLQVGAAASAEVALAVVSASSGRPTPLALVTDVALGRGAMDGITLAAELRRCWSGLGVVIMSGHEPDLARCGPPVPRERRLLKPFAPAALVQAVQDVSAPELVPAR